MDKKALQTLEFNKIKEQLMRYTASPLGKAMAEELVPVSDIEDIKKAQKRTSEAVSMILKKGSLSLGGLHDITPQLRRVEMAGVLSIEELEQVRDFLYSCRKAKSYAKSEGKNDVFEELEPLFEKITSVPDLERDLERCIVSGEIDDAASSALRDIRRLILQANNRIKEQLNSIIHSQTYRNMLQDPVITIRNERFCVPVKQEYKNTFSGMIHDQSATGATVFIEPISVVQLNNKIKDLHSQETAEINRILAQLSDRVYQNRIPLADNIDIMGELDFIFAKGELSIAMRATEPVFNNHGYINIKKGRHPLLNKNTVVPTDIYIGKDFTTLLITGPNTGGKTVSLKTLGLFTLMGQAGLHIPAFDNSELAVFDEVFADIGDEQSIEQSLSTFSSHMSNIVYILNNVTNNSLVLMDELGAGTDPTEGAALAVSIIKYLHALGIRTAVTTHYSELKLYALTSDGVENAGCEFDVETLRPTYRLLIGVPGKSNAFAISSRLGLPDHIINDAREFLSHEDVKLDTVLADMEISKKNLIAEQERAESYRRQAEELKLKNEEQRKKLQKQQERIIREANEQARSIISDAKDEADAIIKEIRKMQREGIEGNTLDEQRQKLKAKMEAMNEKLAEKNKPKHKVPKKLKIGDKVYIHSFDQTGIVSSLPDGKGDLTVTAGIMKMKINIKDLSLDTSEDNTYKKPDKQQRSANKFRKSQTVSPELDLRGMMSLDAIERVDKYLDDAYLAGLTPVTIIHGKGTGALRAAVHEHLRTHPHVKSYRLGVYGEGESGVTIVELK
ncbi:MAG: endonuclease MutS2 [Firmicutes bacterium]|nr:endonuclease MutS2 [Bacillota bacterium]